nr:hypothetical protein [Tanacetum cinerariifolium]
MMYCSLRSSKAYKEYYAYSTGEAAPKPKASAKKKKSGSASSTTPPTPIATPTPTTTVVAAPRLSAAAKDEGTGSRPGVPDVSSDDSKEELSWNSSDDEDVDEQTKGRIASEGDKTDESDDDNDDDDDTKIGEQEVKESDEGDDEATESDRESEDEETREQEDESFDPIPRTPEDNEDDDNNAEDQGLRIGEEERMQEEEDAKELYRLESLFTTGSTTVTPIPSPQSIMTPSIISTFTSASQLPTPPTQIPSLDLQSLPTFASVFRFEDRVKSLEDNFSNIPGITNQLQDFIQRENDEFLKTIDENMKKIIKKQVKTQVKAQVTRILPRIEEAVNAQLEAEVLTRLSHSSRTSYVVAADLSEMELKKILIDKMEGNKSIQRSDKQRNLYKALVEAYDADKTILDIYGESTILKRRREDDDQEGPFAGSDRGSKRRREGREHASASTPSKPAIGSAGRSTTGKPPTPNRNWNKSVPAAQGDAQSWISTLTKLGVDTLTLELLAGPTYELIRGSCNSLTELKYHLEEVYKATTDQLDWVNPKGQQYPHNLL